MAATPSLQEPMTTHSNPGPDSMIERCAKKQRIAESTVASTPTADGDVHAVDADSAAVSCDTTADNAFDVGCSENTPPNTGVVQPETTPHFMSNASAGTTPITVRPGQMIFDQRVPIAALAVDGDVHADGFDSDGFESSGDLAEDDWGDDKPLSPKENAVEKLFQMNDLADGLAEDDASFCAGSSLLREGVEQIYAWLPHSPAQRDADTVAAFRADEGHDVKLLDLLVRFHWRQEEWAAAVAAYERLVRCANARSGEHPFFSSADNSRSTFPSQGGRYCLSLLRPLDDLAAVVREPCEAARALSAMQKIRHQWSATQTSPARLSAHPNFKFVHRAANPRAAATGDEGMAVLAASHLRNSLAFIGDGTPRLTRNVPPLLLRAMRAALLRTPANMLRVLELVGDPVRSGLHRCARHENIKCMLEMSVHNDAVFGAFPMPSFSASAKCGTLVEVAKCVVLYDGREVRLRGNALVVADHPDNGGDLLAGIQGRACNSTWKLSQNSYIDALDGHKVRFNEPSSICISTSAFCSTNQVLFVADTGNDAVRCVNPWTGATTTLLRHSSHHEMKAPRALVLRCDEKTLKSYLIIQGENAVLSFELCADGAWPAIVGHGTLGPWFY